jgi:nucleoid-associated protein YgaU
MHSEIEVLDPRAESLRDRALAPALRQGAGPSDAVRPPEVMRAEQAGPGEPAQRPLPPLVNLRHTTPLQDPRGGEAPAPGAGADERAIRDALDAVAGEHRTGGPATPQPPEAAKGVVHYVGPNETLWQVAQKYLGSGSQWKLIAQANPGKVLPNGTVRQGTRLDIPSIPGTNRLRSATPPPSGAPGAPSAPSPSGPLVGGATSPAPAPTANPTPIASYQVRKGDTLWSIAQQQLGDGNLHADILSLNRALLRGDSDNLRPDMKLALPASRKPRP